LVGSGWVKEGGEVLVARFAGESYAFFDEGGCGGWGEVQVGEAFDGGLVGGGGGYLGAGGEVGEVGLVD
jgi:hypothetical protein